MRKRSLASAVLLAILWPAFPLFGQPTPAQQLVADYVRDQVLGGAFANHTLWMTQVPLDTTHVARDVDSDVPDVPFPYASTWLVMIEDDPQPNWAHPCRWLFVNANLLEHTPPLDKDWPPTIFAGFGAGPQVSFGCIGVTPTPCATLALPQSNSGAAASADQDHLYAVLISGGWNSNSNYGRYATNLQSMYQILRGCGFPKCNISVYYADGASLDLDNEDSDSNHSTGDDVDGPASQSNINSRISELCASLDEARDVLLVYTSNHGSANGALTLWDFDGDGRTDSNEEYLPAEFAADTSNCSVFRLFGLLDQCYSGAFVAIAEDGNHANSAIYSAALDSELSWGREYMDEGRRANPTSTLESANCAPAWMKHAMFFWYTPAIMEAPTAP